MIKTPEEILKEEEQKKKQTQILTEDSTYADLGYANLNEKTYTGQ